MWLCYFVNNHFLNDQKKLSWYKSTHPLDCIVRYQWEVWVSQLPHLLTPYFFLFSTCLHNFSLCPPGYDDQSWNNKGGKNITCPLLLDVYMHGVRLSHLIYVSFYFFLFLATTSPIGKPLGFLFCSSIQSLLPSDIVCIYLFIITA